MSMDIDFSDAFGPVDDGVSTDDGVQEVTDPADLDDNNPDEGDDSIDGDDKQETTDPAEDQKQSAAENAKFAAARRKAEKERDDAIAQMKKDHEAELERMVADLGLENPYTGKAITTRAELEAYKKQHAEEERRQMLAKAEENGLSEEDLKAMVKSDPEYREAMRMKQEAAAARERANREAYKTYLDNALKEVNKLDSSVSTMEDLRNHASFKEVDEYVKRGYTIPDAFEKANKEAIRQRERAAIEQQIRNSITGRGHLESNSPRGDGGINVPADVMNEFRMMMPDATDEQIRSWYAKDVARRGRKK